MEKNTGSTQKLFGYFVTAFASCKTILRWHRRAPVLALSLTFALSACNQKTENHTHNPPPDYTGSNMGGGNGGGSVTGTGDGGGGQGIACTDKVKDPRFRGKVMVRDIYEAIRNHNRTMKTIPNDVSGTDTVSPEAIKVLVDSLKHFYGPASANLEFVNEKFWFDFVKKISFLDDEYKLHPSQDANSPIALPDECKIVQIAFWDESSGDNGEGVLYIQKKLWVRLDQTSKVGLLAHEFFFKQARKAGYKNSDFVRNKIGETLSVEGLNPIFENWENSKFPLVQKILPARKDNFKYCVGSSSADPAATAQLYHYLGKDGAEHLVIMNLDSKNVTSSVFNFYHTKFTKNDKPELAAGLFTYSIASDFRGSYLSEGREFMDLLEYKYIDSGYLSVADYTRGKSNLRKYIDKVMKNLGSRSTKELLSGYIVGANDNIKIDLDNPAFGLEQNDDFLLDPSNLKIELISLIKKTINMCEIKNDVDLDIATSLLLAEIKDGVRSGIYPEGFPRWKEALKVLETKESKPSEGFRVCGSENWDKFANEIPRLLFKVYLGSYEAFDFADIKNELRQRVNRTTGYSFEDQKFKFKSPVLKMKTEGREIDLELKCEKFMDVYARVAKNSFPSNLKTQNREMDVRYDVKSYEKILSDAKKKANDPRDIEDALMAMAYKQVYFTLSERFDRSKMFLYYPKNEDGSASDFEKENAGAPSGLEIRPESMKETYQFFREMSWSTSANFIPCEDAYGNVPSMDGSYQGRFDHFSHADGIFEKGCVLAKPNISSSWFKIYFSFPETSLEFYQNQDLVELSKKQHKIFSEEYLRIIYLQRVL